jgi:hypothetical protein
MVTMTKTLLESGVLGAVTGKRVWNARLIASGVSLNGKYYSGEMLKSTGSAAFPVGTLVHADHQTWGEAYDRPEKSVKTIIGAIATEPKLDTVDGVEGLYANVEFTEEWAPRVEQIAPFVGLSISTQYIADETAEREDGVETVAAFVPFPTNSVDLVTVPGAKGKLLRALESFSKPPNVEKVKKAMTAEEIEALATALANKLSVTNDDVSEKDSVDVEEVAEAMIAAGLPKPAREAAFRRIRSGESVKEAIAGEENYMKSLSEALKAKTAEESSAVFRRDTDSNESTYDFRLRGF